MYHSKPVTTNQPGINSNLESLVTRHINSEYQKPMQAHNLQAFEKLCSWLASRPGRALILDSGCGTAMSSFLLARQNPESLVIGVDQSFHRLNKPETEQSRPENCLLLQANCEDLWRLCLGEKMVFSMHYILYPNPWPKSHQVKRRWHGHPVFTVLPELARQTELRSNWQLYLQEFAFAWQLATKKSFSPEAFQVEEPLTLFEKKYWQSGQSLHRLVVE